jgi:hypothetical protein
MYVNPESILMALPLIVPGAAAEPAVMNEDGTEKIAAVPERQMFIIPGAQLLVAGVQTDRGNQIMVNESPTDIHNMAISELNNRKAK